MSFSINKVAVLGAGVMGASIAAHIVGAGIPVYLLDIVPNKLTEEEKAKGLTFESLEFRNRFSNAGKSRVADPKFRAIYHKELASMIKVGNLTDNLGWLNDCDWIIEVVLEDISVKQNLMKIILKYLKPGSIVSSNTSGVSINEIVRDMPLEFRQHFMGTHFFNPPRYMKLFEIIPSKDTLPEYINYMRKFATKKLGKGVVTAKDTPNFIANRIGVQAYTAVMRLTEKYGYSIPKSDIITGEVMGRPRSATFKTGDIVGLDIVGHVANNVINNTNNEKEIQEYSIPNYFKNLVSKGCLGNKTNGGFYKKVKSEKGIQKLVWDYKQGEYTDLGEEKIEAIEEISKLKTAEEKISALVWGDKEENKFAWEAVKSNLLYSANRAPEIANDFKEIDNGMRWGFNWELGPFQIWDAIGVKESVERIKKEGETIPKWIEERMANGKTKFYDDSSTEIPFIVLSSPKLTVVKENRDAVLKNIGDGVACLEFKTKGNAITEDLMHMINNSVKEVEQGDYKGLLIANHSKNFSVGANLVQMAGLAQAKEWNKLETMIREFQYANMSIKYCKRPIVVAPHGMTLGGGTEIALHSHMQVSHAETYMGLVELGVGLVPGGGGCKELLFRSVKGSEKASISELINRIKKIWENISMAKVSSSAYDAVELGYMKASDKIAMNLDYQINDAKEAVIALYDIGFRANMKKDIRLTGKTGAAAIQVIIDNMKEGRFISEYDAFLAKKVSEILTGGNVLPGTIVSEDRILELERETFLSLCGEAKTQERIKYMLIKGKPLRN